MTRYAISFFLTAAFIVAVNAAYLSATAYKDEDLYRYDPGPLVEEIRLGLRGGGAAPFVLEDDLARRLAERGVGAQLVDAGLRELARFGPLPADAAAEYTPGRLAGLYESGLATAFVRDIRVGGAALTLVVFLDRDEVKRSGYTYEAAALGAAYRPARLALMNLLLIALVSYLYTYSVTKPLRRMADRILDLAAGRYAAAAPGRGAYARLDEALNRLAGRLEAARRERETADRAREEWIANVSHDIKTPLTSMMGYGELLGDDEYRLGPEERLRYKELILEKGRYVKDILDELNTALRLKHNRYPLRLEDCDLVELLRRRLVGALNAPAVVAAGHAASFSYGRERISARVDRRLIERAFDNVVGNVFAHNGRPTEVLVRVDVSDEGTALISVDDDGVGVPDGELHLIFDRHYRGTNTKERSEGSGLGLAIARHIIEAHGGSVAPAESGRGGLLVTIRLPLLGPTAAGEAPDQDGLGDGPKRPANR